MTHPCGLRGWLQVRAPGTRWVDRARIGKWLLFAPCSTAAQCWQAVRDLTLAGELGVAAKVGGEDGVELARRAGTGSDHVICAYTRDWADAADVLRVGQLLARFDVARYHAGGVLRYKADEQARRGVAGCLFEMAPPYARLGAARGLAEWARVDLDAARCLRDLALR